ncbi:PREDICTED: translation initiation factor IF-2-like, partial [Chinchilla lanigera]|uniref:translation initiation factor IF-2-like n=1 Tax=Chinchilla lanigera TaxID=34839 RepID=UPI0006972CE2
MIGISSARTRHPRPDRGGESSARPRPRCPGSSGSPENPRPQQPQARGARSRASPAGLPRVRAPRRAASGSGFSARPRPLWWGWGGRGWGTATREGPSSPARARGTLSARVVLGFASPRKGFRRRRPSAEECVFECTRKKNKSSKQTPFLESAQSTAGPACPAHMPAPSDFDPIRRRRRRKQTLPLGGAGVGAAPGVRRAPGLAGHRCAGSGRPGPGRGHRDLAASAAGFPRALAERWSPGRRSDSEREPAVLLKLRAEPRGRRRAEAAAGSLEARRRSSAAEAAALAASRRRPAWGRGARLGQLRPVTRDACCSAPRGRRTVSPGGAGPAPHSEPPAQADEVGLRRRASARRRRPRPRG